MPISLEVVGYRQSPTFQKAANVASALEHLYPTKLGECSCVYVLRV